MTAVVRTLIGVDDLRDEEVRLVLDRAADHARQARIGGPPFTLGAVFMTSSLRTRVGFTTAAIRLGGSPIDVVEARWSQGMSSAESFGDMLRTVTGMVDVAVIRTAHRLDRGEVAEMAVAPLVNGGDGAGEHPTQALIDLFAVERHRGPWTDQVVALCGDMSARSARSLLRLFERMPPRRLVVIAPPTRSIDVQALSPSLRDRVERRASLEVEDVDVLSMVGLPEGDQPDRLDSSARRPFTLSDAVVASMPATSVVLSPMPVIDEIDLDARRDPRVRVFAQSDDAVAVRMAVLELVLGRL